MIRSSSLGSVSIRAKLRNGDSASDRLPVVLDGVLVLGPILTSSMSDDDSVCLCCSSMDRGCGGEVIRELVGGSIGALDDVDTATMHIVVWTLD